MATMLLNLRDVPDDEVAEVRALLDEHGIAYRETAPSFWGISMGAIWLDDADRVEEARALLADYQARRAADARADYQRRRAAGETESFWDRVRAHPVRVPIYVAIVLVVLYFSIKPFVALGG